MLCEPNKPAKPQATQTHEVWVIKKVYNILIPITSWNSNTALELWKDSEKTLARENYWIERMRRKRAYIPLTHPDMDDNCG